MGADDQLDLEEFEDEASDDELRQQLEAAFVRGFAAGRTGRYYAELPPITKRAAKTQFEQYYRTGLENRNR